MSHADSTSRTAAAAASFQQHPAVAPAPAPAPQSLRSAGRSTSYSAQQRSTSATGPGGSSSSSSSSAAKTISIPRSVSAANTSLRIDTNDANRPGVTSPVTSPRSHVRTTLRTNSQRPATAMTSYSSTVTVPAPTRAPSGHAKLHKRGGSGSGSSLPAPPSPFTIGSHSQWATPVSYTHLTLPTKRIV